MRKLSLIVAVVSAMTLGNDASAQGFFTNGVPPAGVGSNTLPLNGLERLPMDTTSGTPPSVSVTSQQLGAIGATQGGENGIIAGDFNQNLWQRGGSIASISTSTYTADRFFAWTAGGSEMTVSRNTTPSESPLGFGPITLKAARTGVGTAQQCFGQVIASNDSVHFQGHTVEFSFWLGAGSGFSGGTLEYVLAMGTGQDEGAAKAAFSVNGLGGSGSGWTGFQRLVDANFTPQISPTRIVAVASVPSGATELLVSWCWQPAGAPGNDYVSLQGPQLIVNDTLNYANGYSGLASGTQASNYRPRQSAIEVRLQKWFFQSFSEPSINSSIVSGLANGANSCKLPLAFGPMRVTPGIIFQGLSNTSWQVETGGGVVTLGTPWLTGTVSPLAVTLVATTVAPVTVGNACLLEGQSVGASKIILDSELN